MSGLGIFEKNQGLINAKVEGDEERWGARLLRVLHYKLHIYHIITIGVWEPTVKSIFPFVRNS